jgi:hypothetical protein
MYSKISAPQLVELYTGSSWTGTSTEWTVQPYFNHFNSYAENMNCDFRGSSLNSLGDFEHYTSMGLASSLNFLSAIIPPSVSTALFFFSRYIFNF